MAQLKLNNKTEFLYLEENLIDKFLEIMQDYTGYKILLICDTEYQKILIPSIKRLNSEFLVYINKYSDFVENEPINDITSQNKTSNEMRYQYLKKSDLFNNISETTLIVAAGKDDEINIAKQISAQFNLPYIAIINHKNSSLSYSRFYAQNFTIKEGVVPYGIIVDLREEKCNIWKQKILVEKTKKLTINSFNFFNELFLGKANFLSEATTKSKSEFNENEAGDSCKKYAEIFSDIALNEQYEKENFLLFFLPEIYFSLSKNKTLNIEHFLYKTLIKILQTFTKEFLLKYKCFKCYDTALENALGPVVNSSYLKYIISNFNNLINDRVCEYYKNIDKIEEKLNEISYLNMYKDKQIINSSSVLKVFKIFAKIQKSPTFLNIIDFYNLF